jgi:hypothetical protein
MSHQGCYKIASVAPVGSKYLGIAHTYVKVAKKLRERTISETCIENIVIRASDARTQSHRATILAQQCTHLSRLAPADVNRFQKKYCTYINLQCHILSKPYFLIFVENSKLFTLYICR